MYEYQYIVMDTGGGIFVNNMEANHRKIIDEEAGKGWGILCVFQDFLTLSSGKRAAIWAFWHFSNMP